MQQRGRHRHHYRCTTKRCLRFSLFWKNIRSRGSKCPNLSQNDLLLIFFVHVGNIDCNVLCYVSLLGLCRKLILSSPMIRTINKPIAETERCLQLVTAIAAWNRPPSDTLPFVIDAMHFLLSAYVQFMQLSDELFCCFFGGTDELPNYLNVLCNPPVQIIPTRQAS